MDQLLFPIGTINTPFHIDSKIKLVHADMTATGLPSPLVEKYIYENVYPYYGNTHTGTFCGNLMKKMIDDTRKYIRQIYNLDDQKVIIFTGNGTTGAINHLVNSIAFDQYHQINIIISSYEHHSNYLPWVEISHRFSNIKIHTIPFSDKLFIDYQWLEDKLSELNRLDCSLNIISITGCSNVSGFMTDINSLVKLKNQFNQTIRKNYLFLDLASLAPYRIIDLSQIDASFISGHKFIGGVGTPGVLICNQELFTKDSPYAPGGGCVIRANQEIIEYEKNLEKRESGGTPNIIGIIKFHQVLKLLVERQLFIERQELAINQLVKSEIKLIESTYSNFHSLFMNKYDVGVSKSLPILTFYIDGLHYDLVSLMLNDLFGIQSRSGISCCGLLSKIIKGKFQINGWCRITFHWTMSMDDVMFIIKSLKILVKYGLTISKLYRYNLDSQCHEYIGTKKYNLNLSKILNVLDQQLHPNVNILDID